MQCAYHMLAKRNGYAIGSSDNWSTSLTSLWEKKWSFFTCPLVLLNGMHIHKDTGGRKRLVINSLPAHHPLVHSTGSLTPARAFPQQSISVKECISLWATACIEANNSLVSLHSLPPSTQRSNQTYSLWVIKLVQCILQSDMWRSIQFCGSNLLLSNIWSKIQQNTNNAIFEQDKVII